MIELAEARILAEQINVTIKGKRIHKVTAQQSPHKFAFFHGDPQSYHDLLAGKIINMACAIGGQLELKIEDFNLVFGDGVNLQYHLPDAKRPAKHQLLLEFEDESALSASVQMYGFLLCFREEEFENKYYRVAKEKPSPLSEEFNLEYFLKLQEETGVNKLSAKAFLATEQRIPGLGNGLLQDILYNAGIHPKRKINTLTKQQSIKMYEAIKTTLSEIIEMGGRDTEKDLFGKYGGYHTKLSKNTVGKPCPKCNSIITKEAYLGGSIYYCGGCQTI